MMIFKYFERFFGYKCRTLASVAIFFCMSSLYAEVAVNNIKKNDKVSVESLTEQNQLPVKTGSAGWELTSEQWEFARSGESILSLPVLNSLINAWLQDKQKMIEIQYPGGEEGEFWVHELSDWLVSLGVPSSSMVIVPGSGAGDMIKFDLVK